MAEAPSTRTKWDLDRLVRAILAAAIIVGLFMLVRYLADVLVPFAVALVLAYLLNPIVDLLESRLKRRTPAVLITVGGCGILLFALTVVLVYTGGSEIASFRSLMRQLNVHAPTAEEVGAFRQRVDDFIQSQENATVRHVFESIRDSITPGEGEEGDVIEQGKSIAKRLVPGVLQIASGALSVLLGAIGLIVILLYLVFLLIDYPSLAGHWREFLPPKYKDDISGFVEEFRGAMSRYFRGQFIIALCTGIILAVGFKLIGLRLAILLGLCVGMLNMVPYLQLVGLIPALLLALVKGLESGQALWLPIVLVLAVFAVAQALQDAVLTPKIMGKTVGLRPVILLLSISIWGKLLGFLGLVVAIPFTCLGIAYYRRTVLGDKKATAVPEESEPA